MARQKKREKFITPNPYYVSKAHGEGEKVLRKGFESFVFEELQKARGYPNTRIKQFPVDDYGFFSVRDLDIDFTVRIVNRGFESDDIFKSPNKFRALYEAEPADIVVLNDFDRQSYRGVALVAPGVIHYEDMTGVMTIIPNADCAPIYLGRIVDIFETLIVAGYICKWDGSYEDDY